MIAFHKVLNLPESYRESLAFCLLSFLKLRDIQTNLTASMMYICRRTTKPWRPANIKNNLLFTLMENLTSFTKFLQACITPVALISGVGLLLLTITNRIGRVIDRVRHLVSELDNSEAKREMIKVNEIRILLSRGKLLRNSIAWILAGMISSCLIVPLILIMSFSETDLKLIGYFLFIISILSIFVSLLYFFKDVLLSLHAVTLEASDYIELDKR